MSDQIARTSPDARRLTAAAEFFQSLKKEAGIPAAGGIRAVARQAIRGLVPTNPLPTPGVSAVKQTLKAGLTKALRA